MPKKPMTASIDAELLNLFEKYCINEDKNRSAVLERLIKEYLELKEKYINIDLDKYHFE